MNQDASYQAPSGEPQKGGATRSLAAVIVLVIIAVVIAIAVGSGTRNKDVLNTYQGTERQTGAITSADASIDNDLNQTGRDIDSANVDTLSF